MLYAMLHKSKCSCRDVELDDGTKLPDNNCGYQCPGDRNVYCGNEGTLNSIYKINYGKTKVKLVLLYLNVDRCYAAVPLQLA